MEPLRPLALAHLPTPLEEAPTLGRELGLKLWIKRDDCTGLATGGNKARKLAWLAADALRSGADTLVTFGGVQSNHARITAAAAARSGLECTLLLGGNEPRLAEGNLLLDRILGAEIEYLGLTPSTLTGDRVHRAFRETEARLRRRGKRPYTIPAGGSEGLGVAACALAWRELAEQMAGRGLHPGAVVVTVGTGGTFAGLVLGHLMDGRPGRVVGISAAPEGMPAAVGVAPLEDLIREGAATLDRLTGGGEASRAANSVTPDDLVVEYGYSGSAYGSPTPECLEALRLAARTEGLLLDPVYTSKAMAGLVDMARRARIPAAGDLVFWHTGGVPALFPYAGALR